MILLSVHYKLLNLQVAVELIGKTAANPNGDGSGKVKFTATADDAISYKFFPDGTSSNAPSGILNKLLQKLVLIYTVTVIASGTGECRRIVLLK
jgi:hypothetical protein